MAKLEFTNPGDSRENWKELPTPGVFVSNLGEVFSLEAGMAKQSEARGYLLVRVRGVNGGKPVGVHRLVAHAFHGECPDGMCVDHIDSNPANNRPENLQYVTPSENTRLYWERRKDNPIVWDHRQRLRKSERMLQQAQVRLNRLRAIADMYERVR